MLVLARGVGQSIIIEDDIPTKRMKSRLHGQEEPPILVTVDSIEKNNKVNLVIKAVKKRTIHRSEIYELTQQTKKQPNIVNPGDTTDFDLKNLCLSRLIGQSITIEDDIPTKRMKSQLHGQEESPVRVTILRINGKQVSIGIEANRDRPVHRLEIYQRIQFEKQSTQQ